MTETKKATVTKRTVYNLRSTIRGRHCGDDIPSSQKMGFLEDDQEALTQMYFIEARKSAVPQKADRLRVNHQVLSKQYQFGGEVVKYLAQHAFLCDVLIEARNHIDTYFSKSTKTQLVLFQNAEIDSTRLFVKIHTKAAPEKAIQNLNSFDSDWWFKMPGEVHKYLEFNLEFE